MNKFLQKLYETDSRVKNFSSDQQIIHQGLAPLMASKSKSTTILKADLLEQSKYKSWQIKALEIFKHFNQQDIKFLVFKGFAYSFLLYDESHIRPYADIDLFVDEADYTKAKDILIKLNYQQLSSRQGKYISFQNSFYDHHSPPTTIDLHWQINNRTELHQFYKFNTLFENATAIKTDLISFKTLNQVDAFILACFHYQAHRPNDRKHIWLYDLALMWHNLNEQSQIKCTEQAKQYQLYQLVQNTVFLLNETFPNCLNINIHGSNITDNSQSYIEPRNKKITDIRNRLKNIQGTNNKLKYLSEYVLQPRSYVISRYNLKSNIWVYLYYPRMWFEDFIKLFKSL